MEQFKVKGWSFVEVSLHRLTNTVASMVLCLNLTCSAKYCKLIAIQSSSMTCYTRLHCGCSNGLWCLKTGGDESGEFPLNANSSPLSTHLPSPHLLFYLLPPSLLLRHVCTAQNTDFTKNLNTVLSLGVQCISDYCVIVLSYFYKVIAILNNI